MRLALLATAALLTASAATVPEMDLRDIVAGSARIIRGEVVRSWTAWDDSRRAIWTHHEIHVDEALRGGAGRFVVSSPGGTLNGLTMHVPGATSFRVGEEVIVFAYQVPNGMWRLRGWGQGKYLVSRTADGARLIRPFATSLHLTQGEGAKPGPPTVAAAPGDLDSFLRTVRGLIDEEGR